MSQYMEMAGGVVLSGIAWVLWRRGTAYRRKLWGRQQYGLQLDQELKLLLHALQQHRGFAALHLSGGRPQHALLEERAHRIDERIGAITLQLKMVPDQRVQAYWQDIVAAWQCLREDVLRLRVDESFQRHTHLVYRVLDLLLEVGDASALRDNLGQRQRELADVLVSHLPFMTELLGQMRALGVAAISRRQIDRATLLRLRHLADRVRRSARLVNLALLNAHVEPVVRQQHEQAQAEMDRFFALVEQEFHEGAAVLLSAESYFSQATSAIDALFALSGRLSPLLEAGYQNRMARLQRLGGRLVAVLGVIMLSMLGYLLYLVQT